jgi:acyl transferase domain-containing protein/NADPH:quinone reductase-like Zn-dependent oxidoreductase
MTDLGLLSADGRCRAFDAKGSGYVRGEGVCAVVLKRRADAELNGDRLRSIVRATGTNHDGTKSAIGLPSAESQERLLRETYRKAHLNPDDTQFFEAHGTGTKAGDPREARAIGSVFATPTRTEPLFLGSVKTNIGHLEGAAGLIGVIKAVLALEQQVIPPNMLFEDPNPEILFEEWKIRVPTTEKPWTVENGKSRRASVNSFGYGGANAHVILEEYPSRQSVTDRLEQTQPPAITFDSQSDDLVVLDHQQRPYLIPLSTHAEAAGEKAVESLNSWLKSRPDASLADLAYSLTNRRTTHNMRSYIVGSSPQQAARQLSNTNQPLTWNSVGPSDALPRIVFIFTGQGAQSSQMGRQLIQSCPPFRASLEKADATLRDFPDGPVWSIVDELLKSEEESMLQVSSYSQPICTALQLALVDLISSWGVRSRAVCGHSSGEIAAAYAAGILSFEAAMAAAYFRGLHMGQAVSSSQPGGMLAVGLCEPDAKEHIRQFDGKLVIAAINSPSSVSISGDEDAIVQLAVDLAEQGVFVRRLKVSQAFHSHHMDPLGPGYQSALEYCASFDTAEAAPTARFFSTVTGTEITEPRELGASYWVQNMVKPVRFADAVSALLQSKTGDLPCDYDILLEIGPHPALRGPVRQILTAQKKALPYVAILDRTVPAFESILDAIGQLHVRGYPLDLQSVNQDYEVSNGELVPRKTLPNRLYDLPSYSWNRTLRSWSATRLIKEHLHHPARHTILGRQVPGSVASSPRWRNFLRLSEVPWLSEHVFDGKALFPGAGYISMAIEAVIRANTSITRAEVASIQLQDINIKAPMTLSDSDTGTETYVELKSLRTSSKSMSDEWFEFAVSSYNEDERFTQNCTGLISLVTGQANSLQAVKPQPTQQDLIRGSSRRIKSKALYKQISDNGLFLGDRFALVKGHVYCGSEYVVAPSVVFRPEQYTSHELSEGTLLYPTILDNCFQSLFTGIESQLSHRLETVFVPTFIKSLSVSGLMDKQSTSYPSEFGISTRVLMPNTRTAVGDVHLHHKDDKTSSSCLVLELQGLEMTAMGNVSGRPGSRTLFFQQVWKPSFDMLTPTQIQDHMPLMREIFQFQHPDSRVLMIPPQDEQVTRSALSYLASLYGVGGRFQYLDMLLSNDASQMLSSGVEAISSTIPGFQIVSEPNGRYGLIIALQDELSVEQLDSIAENTSLIVTNYDLATTLDDWTLILPMSPGLVFRVQRSSGISPASRALTVISPSSTFSGYETSVAEALKQRFDNIRHLTFANLAQTYTGNDDKEDFLILPGSGFGLDDLSVDSWEGLRCILGQENIRLIWVSYGGSMDCTDPTQAMVQGLLRVARNESQGSRFVNIDVDGPSSSAEFLAERICEVLDGKITEEEIAIREDVPYIPRVLEDPELNAKLVNGVGGEPSMQNFGSQRALKLQIGTIGLLETLHFAPDEAILTQPLKDDEVEIRVMATALNFRDIAATMGIVQDKNLGDECSGIVHRVGAGVETSRFKAGDRVVACRPGQGAHSTFVRQPAALCLKMPDSFSFTVAASWSGVLTTAYYALIMVARLQPGETILIHSGSGGVGQMAIQLAQRIGAKILATCAPAKRDFLKSHFGLDDSQIFSSRDDSFVENVMTATEGRGVDVILNSLAGKLLTASWDCIATLGRFVEIGKRDIHQNANLPMAPFRRNVMFASVDLVLIYETQPRLAQHILEESAKLFFNGEVKPAHPIVEYTFEEVEKAMRLMQQGKHVGKVVLVPGPEDKVPVVPARFDDTRQRFDENKVYLIVGGLGGLGTALAEWMVRSGARRIAVFSRSGVSSDSAAETVSVASDEVGLVVCLACPKAPDAKSSVR